MLPQGGYYHTSLQDITQATQEGPMVLGGPIHTPYIYTPLHPGLYTVLEHESEEALLPTCKNAVKVDVALATLRPFGRF